jgi:multiple sugar transport system substrate-binding protein
MTTHVFARAGKLVIFLSLLVLIISACSSPAASDAINASSVAEASASSGTDAQSAAAEASGSDAPTPTVDLTLDPEAINFWSRDSAEGLVTPLVESWNASHPTKIKATFIPSDQFVQKFATALAGGEAPDLVAVDLIYMPAYAAAEQMTDLTDLAKGLPFFDQLSPSHVRLGTYNDRVYALPFNAEGSVLVYNKDLFRQAGLDPEKPPTNWAEMAEYSKKITALGDDTYGFYFSGACAGCNAFTVLPYIWASGGDVISEDGTTATVTDPAVKSTLEFLHQMYADKQIPESSKADTGTEFLNIFTSGKIGMVGSGAFSIAALKASPASPAAGEAAASPLPQIDFGIAPLPGKDGGSSSFAGGDTIAIPASSKRPDEAFEFIKWFLSDEVQIEQLAKNGGLPLRVDLVDNKYSQEDPRYITVGNAMFKEGRTPYLLPYNDIFNDANGPWLAMLQRAVFDGEIDAAIAEAQDSFSSILAQQ